MRWFTLVIMMLFVGCQPSYAEKEVQLTTKSCQVATQLAKRSLDMFRSGKDQFDVMVMLNNYNTNGSPEAFAGKVFVQLTVVDLQKNVFKAFKDKPIMFEFTEACTKQLGFKIPKGK
ncbi:hypothetical protein PHABIO_362 [Pseudomonas phage Phabio]|uniref:Lipoprotein n=1 Tax=Pseudomonas phage Phabio TaxID=2006668 RepID=A0A1Y0SYZ6_9CAUD|nr:hypothetical protein MZD05_gp362 [Pseudomonas phage Phabio]ARV76993.1 hypothetical protein PHABIO_362 [Pseudomonas phage Phabio]